MQYNINKSVIHSKVIYVVHYNLPRLEDWLKKLKSKLTKNGEKTDAIDSFIHDLDELAQDKEFLNMEKVKLKEIFKNQNYLSIIKDNIENICEILTINIVNDKNNFT